MPTDSPIRFYLFANHGWLEVVPMSEGRAAELCTEGRVYVASYATRPEAEAKRKELNAISTLLNSGARKGAGQRLARMM
jgi:hypothetical protein